MNLDREIRQVLAELELISHGSITAYNSSGGGHAESDRLVPPGESFPPHLFYRGLFVDAWESQRDLLLAQARTALAALKVRGATAAKPLTDREVLERRIIEEGKGWTAQEVSVSLRCSPLMVRRVRIREELDGYGREALVLTEDLRERACELLAKGMTERQIELLTGLKKSSIRRLGGKAA